MLKTAEESTPCALSTKIKPDSRGFPWTMTHKAQGFTLDDYPNVKRWYADVRARPQVQAGLAIGKFVKAPFDEEARRNMFGQAAKELAGRNDSDSRSEERRGGKEERCRGAV